MACPKVAPAYPNTATSIEVPWIAIVRRADPGFDREHRFDLAYEFGRRRFLEDALLHGAYGLPPALAGDAWLVTGEQDDQVGPTGPFSPGFSSGFEGPVFETREVFVAALDAQFRFDNGFCDPFDDGTVQTGTGAGGANPGAVPSLSALIAADGALYGTADGFALEGWLSVGAVFHGGGG